MKEHFIIQKFINDVSKGDKKNTFNKWEPVGAINRIPNEKQVRANLHIGGRAIKTKTY